VIGGSSGQVKRGGCVRELGTDGDDVSGDAANVAVQPASTGRDGSN
jgi:hypothetical protein